MFECLEEEEEEEEEEGDSQATLHLMQKEEGEKKNNKQTKDAKEFADQWLQRVRGWDDMELLLEIE